MVLPAPAPAQDRLKTMPGFDRYQQMSGQIAGSIVPGVVTPDWSADGRSFEYRWKDKWYRYDLGARRAVEIPAPAAGMGRPTFAGRGGRGGRGGAPARGRQYALAMSPDSTHRAVYRDRNVYVTDANGGNEVAVTTDGSEPTRVKYGTASWVYGEELDQRTAMWWSPDGKKLAYYRFDESRVPDFYITLDETKLQTTVDTEAYPKPGVPNPVVDLFVYDVATRQSTRIDVRDGKPFENDVVGYYVYHVDWSPDGSELTFYRTNRRQNILEFTACAPSTGKCRVVVHDEWLPSWLDNNPTCEYLSDGKRFIWESVRSGYTHYYLYDLSGALLDTLTRGPYDATQIVRVDEDSSRKERAAGALPSGVLYYMARDGDNYLKMQLHRVGLDGKGDKRLTDPAYTHSVSISPDGRYFTDVAQTHEEAPTTRLVDANGRMLAELVRSDMSKYDALGLQTTQMFTYLAGDGATTLHGTISFPSNFDPSKKYPVLVPVYGGPESSSSSERFALPSQLTELGFLVVTVDSRAVPGVGKRTLDDLYLKLGQVEMDDMALGIRALWDRPYLDKDRVGIYGTSYGGYAALMEILRHPDVFAAASASSPPTDWRNYDTIYTERYMWIPEENKDGYDKGSAMTYVDSLRGRLMLYYGTADNNVHNTNVMQVIQALQRAGKSFEVQVGPDQGHSGVNSARMLEFFIENLVMKERVRGVSNRSGR